MKTKDGQFIKRNGKWLRLPRWLKDWRETQTPKEVPKTPPRGANSVIEGSK